VKTEIIDPGRASADQLPEIAGLLGGVFQRKKAWLDELRWEYLEHPRSRSWWVNIRDDGGALVAHSALLAVSPLDDPRFDGIPVWFSLNTAVRADATQPGLMIAGIRTLLQKVEAAGPAIVLGVANANSAAGFTRLLKFDSLGPLSLTLLPPWQAPRVTVPRAVRLEAPTLQWRAKRPGTDTYATARGGQALRRIQHLGVPLDGVLTAGADPAVLAASGLPSRPGTSWLPAPRLYASFGARVGGGLAVPDRFKPSPLRYICRSLAKAIDRGTLADYLMVRRFEFIDFDVL